MVRQPLGELLHGARQPVADVEAAGVGREAEDEERRVGVLQEIAESSLRGRGEESPDAIDGRGVLRRIALGELVSEEQAERLLRVGRLGAIGPEDDRRVADAGPALGVREQAVQRGGVAERVALADRGVVALGLAVALEGGEVERDDGRTHRVGPRDSADQGVKPGDLLLLAADQRDAAGPDPSSPGVAMRPQPGRSDRLALVDVTLRDRGA